MDQPASRHPVLPLPLPLPLRRSAARLMPVPAPASPPDGFGAVAAGGPIAELQRMLTDRLLVDGRLATHG